MSRIIFLADDDSDDANLFQEVLSEIDPTIVFCRSWDGREVLDKLNDKNLKRPDIIFLDVNMPGMDGWHCLAELKNNETFKHIPVIMYSTSTHKRDMEIAMDLGALCFITKPDDFKTLKRILDVIVAHFDGNLQEAIKQVSSLKEIHCYSTPGKAKRLIQKDQKN